MYLSKLLVDTNPKEILVMEDLLDLVGVAQSYTKGETSKSLTVRQPLGYFHGEITFCVTPEYLFNVKHRSLYGSMGDIPEKKLDL